MSFMYVLVIIILLIAIVSTLLITGKSDENYRGSTKRNTTNLTLIYVVVITLSLISLGVYIRFFA
ncbi:uncharacterized protein HemY [Bacillus niacini]|uniref:Uncharacterized protein HemY n=1 Tax=Neobacillus niacini TaxID=86668 RepID=A0A852TDW5_9BACI|nr:hypothetical protein [Neobacillus niacini]NYE07040.1 uncharacterized protein HemY [Neobacillus niacini]